MSHISLDKNTLMGPLIDQSARDDYHAAIDAAIEEGGQLLCGGKSIDTDNGFYVEPTIIEAKNHYNEVRQKVLEDISNKKTALEENIDKEIIAAEEEIKNLKIVLYNNTFLKKRLQK